MLNIRVLYKVNENFKSYVEKYCHKHEVTVEEALTHSIVSSAAEYYEEVELGKQSVSKSSVGAGAEMGECK